MLKALWNIFNAFNQPREELPTGDASEDLTLKSGLSGNGAPQQQSLTGSPTSVYLSHPCLFCGPVHDLI